MSPNPADPSAPASFAGVDYPFPLDPFQLEAIAHLDEGRSVVVAAPTASGKTLVAEHAIGMALHEGGRVFYTTPIKALSNQKFHDFGERFGRDNVGLLTGDTVVNGDAPVVVMTTEVLRNMLYSESRALRNLQFVIMDEVHFLQDPYRGPVWEEVIINTDTSVRFVYLSATVSNTDELTEWLESVRGPTGLVFHATRPVELTNMYLVAERKASKLHLIEMLEDGRPNRAGRQFDPPNAQQGGRQRRGAPRNNYTIPRRDAVLRELQRHDLLPAINFIFSRAGTDDAVEQIMKSGVDLTTAVEKSAIRDIAQAHVRGLSPDELKVLGYARFLEAWERGVASHHAGLVPAFKEAVEACFVEGLVKLVFATETLALGINMPARAVVIEKLTKFNGETHRFLTPLEYTQLTGRAGRRGIDTAGFAIVLWSPWSDFSQAAELAASQEFALRSVFRPTYNMAANVLLGRNREGAHELLDRSFAQYQTDSDVVKIELRIGRAKSKIAAAEKAIVCEHGDVLEYVATLKDEPKQIPQPSAVGDALARLKPGDVVAVPFNEVSGAEPAVILSTSFRGKGEMKLVAVGRSERIYDLVSADFVEPPKSLAHVNLPVPYQPNDAGFQHEALKLLQRSRLRKPGGKKGGKGKNQKSQNGKHASHPVEQCPDVAAHVKGAKELHKRQAQLERLNKRKAGSADRLARQFDELVGILQLRGYVADWNTTPAADMLRRIYHESDLAIAETIRLGLLDDLRPNELAALLSNYTYRHRGADEPVVPRIRDERLSERLRAMQQLVEEIQADESVAGMSVTPDLDPGFMRVAMSWAGGDGIDTIMKHEDLTGGDFVRQIRQLIDLLRQVSNVAVTPETRSAAAAGADALHRGVVASSSSFEPVTDDPDNGDAPDESSTKPEPHEPTPGEGKDS